MTLSHSHKLPKIQIYKLLIMMHWVMSFGILAIFYVVEWMGRPPNLSRSLERTGGRANGSERILNIERTLGLQNLRTTNVMIKATKYFRLERKGTPVIFLFGGGAHQVDSLLGKPCRPTNPCSIIKNPPFFLSPNYSEHLPSSPHSSFQRTPTLPTYLKITATRP